VVTDLGTVTEPPDIIHGQHTHETLTALLAFPDVPGIQMHHGWIDQAPVLFPRILRHVPVDDTVRDRLVSEWGVPPDRIEVVRNFVNPSSLPVRAALPEVPRRALVFSNSAAHHLAAIRQACTSKGIAVDAIGADVGNVAEHPGDVLRSCDIVFAKARCAMEAMAVGTAVVLCDRSGLGPMVSSSNFDALRRVNFGLRTLRDPISADAIARRLDSYDPADAAIVSQRIRSEAHIDDAIDQLEDLYERVGEQWRAGKRDTGSEEMRAIAAYLQRTTAEPLPRAAMASLFKRAYFTLRHVPLARWVMPRPGRALRLYRALRRD
jgi:hypothetical protein